MPVYPEFRPSIFSAVGRTFVVRHQQHRPDARPGASDTAMVPAERSYSGERAVQRTLRDGGRSRTGGGAGDTRSNGR